MRHNKKRNSALLYEFLVRHTTKCLVEGNKEDAAKALEISKKFFSIGKPLYRELQLFKTLLETEVRSRRSAEKLIDVVCVTAKKENVRNIDAQKSQLIKEINYTFNDPSFYSYKIPHYTVYASIQTLLNEARNKKKLVTEVQKIQLEDVVCEHLVSKKQVESPQISVNPQYDNTVYKFVLKRFHEKYDGKLTEGQKHLVTQYAKFLISKDDSELKEIINRESNTIKKKLKEMRDPQVTQDKSLMSKLSECYKKLASTDFSVVDESKVLEVLQYMQLIRELES